MVNVLTLLGVSICVSFLVGLICGYKIGIMENGKT